MYSFRSGEHGAWVTQRKMSAASGSGVFSAIRDRTARRVAGCAAILLVAACSTLKPPEPAYEKALPRSDDRLWQDLDDTRSDPWFHLLNSGEDALAWRLRAIDSAADSIDLMTFLWKPDASGLEVLQHLIHAADRGVRVRVLLDDSFTMHEDLTLHAVDSHPNIEFRIYNPFEHRADDAVLRHLFNAGDFSRINHRMHNKALIIDGHAAIVGGRNLADEYFGKHETFNFRDMEVLSVGPVVEKIAGHFDLYWNSRWSMPIAQMVENVPQESALGDVRLLSGSSIDSENTFAASELREHWASVARGAHPGSPSFYFDRPASENPANADEAPNQLAERLLRVIEQAESEIVLVSAYLIPTPELEDAIANAEARGVEVRILTNSLRSNNHLPAHSAYQRHLRRLLESGADIHEMRVDARDRALYMRDPVDEKRIGLHAKLLVVDEDLVFIGSCNLDPRSLNINTEAGLIVESVQLNAAVREAIAVDFHQTNSWTVRLGASDELVWISDERILREVPADSPVQRLEDWFLSLLPIDTQM